MNTIEKQNGNNPPVKTPLTETAAAVKPIERVGLPARNYFSNYSREDAGRREHVPADSGDSWKVSPRDGDASNSSRRRRRAFFSAFAVRTGHLANSRRVTRNAYEEKSFPPSSRRFAGKGGKSTVSSRNRKATDRSSTTHIIFCGIYH